MNVHNLNLDNSAAAWNPEQEHQAPGSEINSHQSLLPIPQNSKANKIIINFRKLSQFAGCCEDKG